MMEMWEGSNYAAIMSLPSTRRYRLCIRKRDLEEKRRQELKNQSKA